MPLLISALNLVLLVLICFTAENKAVNVVAQNIDSEILHILSKEANVKFQILGMEDKCPSQPNRNIYRNISSKTLNIYVNCKLTEDIIKHYEYIRPIKQEGVKFITPLPHARDLSNAVYYTFSLKVWIVHFSTFTVEIFIIALIVTHRRGKRQKLWLNFLRYYFYSVQVMIGFGIGQNFKVHFSPRFKKTGQIIVLVFYQFILHYLLMNAYCAGIYDQIINPRMEKSLDTFHQVNKAVTKRYNNWDLKITDISPFKMTFKQLLNFSSDQLVSSMIGNSIDHLNSKMTSLGDGLARIDAGKNVVLMLPESYVDNMRRTEFGSRIHIGKETFINIPSAPFIFPKGNKYTEKLNSVYSRLVSSGIIQHLERKVKLQLPPKPKTNDRTFKPLTIDHVKGLFRGLFGLSIIAVGVFIFEIRSEKMKQRENNMKRSGKKNGNIN